MNKRMKPFEKHIQEWPVATRMAYRFIHDPEVVHEVNDRAVEFIRSDRLMTIEDDCKYYNARQEAAVALLEDMIKAVKEYY